MPASIVIRSAHGINAGAPASHVEIQSGGAGTGALRFKAADNDTADNNNPLVIPSSGTVWSFLKQLVFRVGATPAANEISNLKVYSDGAKPASWNGIDIKAKANAAYVDPIAQAQTMLVGMDAAGSMFTTYGSAGAALAIPRNGSAATAANTDISQYVQMQMSVASTASPSTLPGETFTFQYDET